MTHSASPREGLLSNFREANNLPPPRASPTFKELTQQVLMPCYGTVQEMYEDVKREGLFQEQHITDQGP